MEKSKELLEQIICAIVEDKEAVYTQSTIDQMGVLLELRVAKEDMSKIIGKSGNTAKAIRTIIHIVGIKEGARVCLKILEPEIK